MYLPLSINKISYLKEIGQNTIYVDSNSESKMLCLFNINEISDFLTWELDINNNYIATIEFIPDISKYDIDAPQMILSKPFLINKFSSSETIMKFIDERLYYMVDYYCLDDTVILDNKNRSGPGVILNYTKFYY
uniref:hypothetical protein n=1 Tax=Russula vinacea TaxID=517384 RepID=UPI0031F3F22A